MQNIQRGGEVDLDVNPCKRVAPLEVSIASGRSKSICATSLCESSVKMDELATSATETTTERTLSDRAFCGCKAFSSKVSGSVVGAAALKG